MPYVGSVPTSAPGAASTNTINTATHPASLALAAAQFAMGGPPPPPPTEGQTYCLRWNNHKSNLVEILDTLIKGGNYVDCTIVVDDHIQFKAHRVVLAANSPYFQSILQDVPMDHCSIIFPGVKEFEMRALLEYMYTGEVNVTQSQIPKIMRIAEDLEVKGLFDMTDLKEKFNKLGEEHSERSTPGPYTSTVLPNIPPYTTAATSSSSVPAASPQNGGSKAQTDLLQHQHNSSSVISTSTHISPSAAPTSSSSPPYSIYKSPYSNIYSKSPVPLATNVAPQTSTVTTPQTPTHTQTSQQSSAERSQWPLSPTAAAAAMLSSVYESAPDMNPLKRKKLSSISSMLMNRDTPILRNVLAQANPADSSQPMPLLFPTAVKAPEKSSAEKTAAHASLSGTQNNNHTFNGSDYSSDKKYPDEPHSPFTDRSFDDEPGFEQKGSFGENFAANSNQKPEWKRYKQYSRTDIMSAIQCVRDGMSALQASRKFGVPSRTLYDKVKKLGITTGRPMNRTMKRSPSSVESSAAFPYTHGYGGPSEPLLSSMHHEARDEREPKEHHRSSEHHMPTSLHPAAALLDHHAFLQQALENRGTDIAGREALHAMALAAAAHAAANRMSSSPGPNGAMVRSPSPSPNFSMKYARQHSDHDLMMEREKERRMIENEMEREREREREHDIKMEMEHERVMERVREREQQERNRERKQQECERDADDEDDQVEDLSLARKQTVSPTLMQRRAESPYSPTRLSPPTTQPPTCSTEKSVIMPPISYSAKLSGSSNDEDYRSEAKREMLGDDGRAD